jgi:small subunit ribosomal protein S8
MNVTDPIADLLTRLRNGAMARHTYVEIPSSKMKQAMVQILKEEGYIKDFDNIKGKTWDLIRVELKYFQDRSSAISKSQRVSRPGRRVYCSVRNLPKVRNGLGVAVLSTPKGIMTDRNARKLQVGGEWLCSVW